MAQRLIPEEVIETWEECLLLGETDKDFFDKATEVGAELVRVLGELDAGPAESVAALIVLAGGGGAHRGGKSVKRGVAGRPATAMSRLSAPLKLHGEAF